MKPLFNTHNGTGVNESSDIVTPPPSRTPALDLLLRPVKLNDSEVKWRDRYTFLHDRGFLLRPRYHPEWTPSWVGTKLDPLDCEDSFQAIVCSIFLIRYVYS